MQKIIVADTQQFFQREVNEHMLNGWKIVPGTIYGTSYRKSKHERDPPNEQIFTNFLSVVLEKNI